ncbi:hypothetical protein TNCV_4796721 [Trichonephila clavipes]|nr:hypothetical protein TNCV_4796721 [Trichonephila clavipes]
MSENQLVFKEKCRHLKKMDSRILFRVGGIGNRLKQFEPSTRKPSTTEKNASSLYLSSLRATFRVSKMSYHWNERGRWRKKIGESLAICFKGMRPLENAGKNGLTMAYFSFLMLAVDLGSSRSKRQIDLQISCHNVCCKFINHQTCDPHTIVHHDLSQTADRTKFTHISVASTVCHSRLLTVKLYYSGAWLDQGGIMLIEDV